MHRKTITLTEQQDGWVKEQVKSGYFGNDSEYIRHLILRDRQTQERLTTLRQALMEGKESGKPQRLDMAAVKKAGRRRIKVGS